MRENKEGQVLVGILISLAILLILSGALFTLSFTSLDLVTYSRARITARHLAEEKIELIRNLPFEKVGTSGGIPNGPLPQNETIRRNSLNYNITTNIVYIDDPFDELAPTDLLPNDYKRVRIDVSWEGTASSNKNPITLITDIAPKGLEEALEGGTLSILVFDSQGVEVPQAQITIVADETSPPVNLTLQTNSSGRIILPGAPVCNECYKITVTKDGYSQERTYSTTEVANPTNPHATIIEFEITQLSFTIDKLSTLNVSSVTDRDSGFLPLANQTFKVTGAKIIGTDIGDNPVYKFDEEITTNSSGNYTLEDMEWDNYQFVLQGTARDISGTNPLLPISLLPGTTQQITIATTTHTDNNLLLIFTDSGATPIATVSATLTLDPYNQTLETGTNTDPDFGQVFFSNLTQSTYTIDATAVNYTNYNNTVNILNNTIETIILNEN